jgi:hypothetical protein
MADNGHDINVENVNPAVIPSESEQDFLRRVWIEGLAEMLGETRSRWEDAFRTVRAEAASEIAELRAAAAEFRSTMEAMIAARLAQLRQPADGKEGPRGEAGPPGRIEGVRPYVEDTVHYEGDIVVREGSTYQAKRDTSRAPPHADWACIAAAGRDARMPKVCGTYHDSETYKYLSIVALNGSAFVAKCDSPGECPGDGWQLIASAGRAGKPGPMGERGESGPRGERGLPSLNIESWKLEPERYLLTPILQGGHEGPPVNLRAFFEQYHEECGA